MSGEFAGVTIPDYGSSEAPQSSNQENVEAKVSGDNLAPDVREADKSQAPGLTDLEKLERFRFNGRELTPKELKSQLMAHKDYTQKTMELKEARKFADNFHHDLRTLLSQPNRLADFKKIYPAEYVQAAEEILQMRGQSTGQVPQQENQQQSNQDNLPPQMKQALEKIERWDSEIKEANTAAITQMLDTLHGSLAQKYPFADSDVVDLRVNAAIEKGLKVDKDSLPKILEKAYQQHDEAMKAKWAAQQKSKVEEQVKAGRKAQDTGRGGSMPGQPPRKYSKFAEIREEALRQFDK